MNEIKVVEKFLKGFNEPSQLNESLSLLDEKYQFTNPMLSLNSKTAFTDLAKQIAEVITAIRIIRSSTNENWVSVFYEFKTNIPGLESNLATEWFRLEQGKICESILIYDASDWRAVYAQI